MRLYEGPHGRGTAGKLNDSTGAEGVVSKRTHVPAPLTEALEKIIMSEGQRAAAC